MSGLEEFLDSGISVQNGETIRCHAVIEVDEMFLLSSFVGN